MENPTKIGFIQQKQQKGGTSGWNMLLLNRNWEILETSAPGKKGDSLRNISDKKRDWLQSER